MDKLRNIKNRLSLSVDKLSPSRRSPSGRSSSASASHHHNRKSMPLRPGVSPLSEGDIPASVKASRPASAIFSEDDIPSSVRGISTVTIMSEGDIPSSVRGVSITAERPSSATAELSGETEAVIGAMASLEEKHPFRIEEKYEDESMTVNESMDMSVDDICILKTHDISKDVISELSEGYINENVANVSIEITEDRYILNEVVHIPSFKGTNDANIIQEMVITPPPRRSPRASRTRNKSPRAPSASPGGGFMAEVLREVGKITDITEEYKDIKEDESKESKENQNNSLRQTSEAEDNKLISEESNTKIDSVENEKVIQGVFVVDLEKTSSTTRRKTVFDTLTNLKTSDKYVDAPITMTESQSSSADSSAFKTIASKRKSMDLTYTDGAIQEEASTTATKLVKTEKENILRSDVSENSVSFSSKSSFKSMSSDVSEYSTGSNSSAFKSIGSEQSSLNSSAFKSISSEKSALSETSTLLETSTSSVQQKSRTDTKTQQPVRMMSPTGLQYMTSSSTGEKIQKKESIYSRLTKKKDKEPIYAKVKPKLHIETSFKPIEPSVAKGTGQVIKPSPIYSPVLPQSPTSPIITDSRPISPSSPISLISPSSPFSPDSPITPSSPISPLYSPSSPTSPGGPFTYGTKISLSSRTYGTSRDPNDANSSLKSTTQSQKEPIYSKIIPKELRCNTLPKEPIYSKVKKRDHSASSTLPRKQAPKDPIYDRVLPVNKRDSTYSQGSDSDYGKVTVRMGDTVPELPRRPTVITIENPGYAAPNPGGVVLLNSLGSSPPPPPPSTSPPPLDDASIPQPSSVELRKKVGDSLSPDSRRRIVSDISLVQESSDTESIGRNKLSQLVEELATELEEVSRRIGVHASTDDVSKKEVLAKLLSVYDVPKNLRRVEEAKEADILEAEKALMPKSVSMDELRFVDDQRDNARTVYSDIPDYSHDEFFIALDDENDPRYASLTREMSLQQSHLDDESPAKVSRHSAQMYHNAMNVVSALKVLINSKSTKANSVLTKMGTLARPYTSNMKNIGSENSWIQRVVYHKSGHNGFDELRRYIKSGGELCKELAVIMHERAELEASYSKGLNKLSGKLLKASKETMGTVNTAWQMVGSEMEQESEVHKNLSSSLADDVVKPLRNLIETQHKIRKGVEGMVDKTTRNVHEWRTAESKSKKTCYGNQKDNEKIQDMMLEARLGRGKTLTDKETIKMEKQRRKAEESVQKGDLEYYTCCMKAERARLEWETAIYKGSNCFQTLEEERLQSLHDLILKYQTVTKDAAPKLVACVATLEEPITACDVEKDIQTVIAAKGTGENLPEQLLPDFYPEDMNNIMNRERRKESLEKFVNMLRSDLERERRGKQGVENLAKALQETPTFGGEDSQQDVNDKLQHMKAMLAYLEAARYKVQCSLDELNNRPRMTHPLAKHIEVHRDKTGASVSILKVPPWVRGNSVDVSPVSESPAGSPNWNDRGTADGTSVQPDSDFEDIDSLILEKKKIRSQNSTLETNVSLAKSHHSFRGGIIGSPPVLLPRGFMQPFRYPSLMIIADEFSSQGSDRDYQSAVTGDDVQDSLKTDEAHYARPLPSIPTGGRCKALYDYEANMYDELTIRTGDIINIHEKQPDGWWVGELEGVVGIFPATYVEEID